MEKKIVFKSWTDDSKKSDFSHFLSFEDYATLNFLALTYHSAFGYDREEHFFKEINVHIEDLFSEMIDEEEEGFYIDLQKAKTLATSYKLRHKIIVVRLAPHGESGWREKPEKTKKLWFYKEEKNEKYWYEFPSGNIISKRKWNLQLLGPLSDRKYIKVVDLFEEIEISSEKKKSPITIDDVLFACRGLCADDTRGITGFNVLSDNGSTLVLMAQIDNWST